MLDLMIQRITKRIGKDFLNIMKQKQVKALIDYDLMLLNEIQELKTRLKPHDTGHIHTTINVLNARRREIRKRLDGYYDWRDDMLLGV